MKLRDVNDIWSADLSALSSFDQGAVFVRRARLLLKNKDIRQGLVPSSRGKIRRSWLAKSIGCSLGTISQNCAIRRLLETSDSIARRAVPKPATKIRLSGHVETDERRLHRLTMLANDLKSLETFTNTTKR